MEQETADQTADIEPITAGPSTPRGGDGQTMFPSTSFKAAIASAYDAARERGASRYEAFVRAIHLYRSHCPDVPANRAGTEVARILLKAARSEMETEMTGSAVFPRRGDMESAGSA